MRRNEELLAKINKIRKFETKDIAKRLGVLTAERVWLKNYPQRNPIKTFNPSIIVDEEYVRVYTRIILGYYMYVSLIAKIDMELNDLLAGYVNMASYPAEIIVGTDTKYDFWGAEDPRVQEIDGEFYMTYSGRTKWYMTMFTSEGKFNRVLPVVAKVHRNRKETWKKIAVLTPNGEKLESDKDVVFLKGSKKLFVLHRPNYEGKYLSMIGTVSSELLKSEEIREFHVMENYVAIDPAPFEWKNGWSTPPVKIGNKEHLVILHGVDSDLRAYRVFAMLLHDEGDELVPTAVTPTYIMEPKEAYEMFGDRPMTIFPCGIWKIDDSLLISYGASDSFVAFALIPYDELLHELDRGRIV